MKTASTKKPKSAKPETLVEEFGEIYKDQRPKMFKDIIGQRHVTQLLIQQLKAKKVQHTMLFSGPSGVGKTTIARILASKLNGGKPNRHDIYELNCAGESRGIDTIRAMKENFRKRPLRPHGCKVFILDECFHPSTLVETDTGPREIGGIRAGDSVYGADGLKAVRHVFHNRVHLNRIVRVGMSDGGVIFTSEDHEFLTPIGWMPAKGLEGLDLLSIFGYPVSNSQKPAGDLSATDIHMHPMQRPVHSEEAVREARSYRVQSQLHSASRQRKEWDGTIRGTDVHRMSQGIHCEDIQPREVLQQVVRGSRQLQESDDTESEAVARGEAAGCGFTSGIQRDARRGAASCGEFRTYAPESDYGGSEERGCDEGHSETQRDARHPRSPSGRQWKADSSSDCAVACVGREMALRGAGAHKKKSPVPNVLQNRHRARRLEAGDRGRWENASVEKGYLARCQEDSDSRCVRVVSVARYERGCNDADFVGVVGSAEVACGYATFIDLEVEGHPSYHAGGVPVHNCHRLTGDAQEALLKMLEDTPLYVYVVLCSSNPDKILNTIRTRAMIFKCELATQEELLILIRREATRYAIELTKEEEIGIAQAAQGSHRKALVLLNGVRFVTDVKDRKKLIERMDDSVEAVNLARALMSAHGLAAWPAIAKVLKELKGTQDPESVRWVILSYFAGVCVNQPPKSPLFARCLWVMQCFRESFTACGYSGLVTSSAASLSFK